MLEQAKARLGRRLGCSEEHAGLLGVSGALAGLTSTIATTPLDVVKTRLQCADAPVPIREVVRGVVREAGLRGFYAGLMPRLLSAVPRSVCTVVAYERAVALCSRDERVAEVSPNLLHVDRRCSGRSGSASDEGSIG
jgi:hypothetical protein